MLKHLGYLSYLETANSNNVFSLNGVNYDNRNGLGNVPMNDYSEIMYRGFITQMKARKFLDCVPSRGNGKDIEFYIDYIKSGKPIAAPFLSIDYKTRNRVNGHEGRHRATAILEVHGNIEISVQIYFHGYKARDLAISDIKHLQQNMISQFGSKVPAPAFSDHVIFQNRSVDIF